MADTRTLAIDIGGTGIKLALLDEKGGIIGERARTPTPPKPVSPEQVLAALDTIIGKVGEFDRVSCGFPGAVREGRILTAPNLGTELWSGFDLQGELAKRLKKPVRVMNDADVQGFGAIHGKGVEMVLTLGTGAGTSIFSNGQIIPHLELAHHPVRGSMTYDQYIGRAAFEKKGKKAWSKRVERVIGILRTVVNFDHLYLGGGNAKQVKFKLPEDVTVVPNTDGLTGGIALWQAEEARGGNGKATRRRRAAAVPAEAAAARPRRRRAAAATNGEAAAAKARRAPARGRGPGRGRRAAAATPAADTAAAAPADTASA